MNKYIIYERCVIIYDMICIVYLLIVGFDSIATEDKKMLNKAVMFVYILKIISDLMGRRFDIVLENVLHTILCISILVDNEVERSPAYPIDIIYITCIYLYINTSIVYKIYNILVLYVCICVSYRTILSAYDIIRITYVYISILSVYIYIQTYDTKIEDDIDRDKYNISRWKDVLIGSSVDDSIGTGTIEYNTNNGIISTSMFNTKNEVSLMKTMEDMKIINTDDSFIVTLKSSTIIDHIYKHTVYVCDKYYHVYYMMIQTINDVHTYIVTYRDISYSILNNKLMDNINIYNMIYNRLTHLDRNNYIDMYINDILYVHSIVNHIDNELNIRTCNIYDIMNDIIHKIADDRIMYTRDDEYDGILHTDVDMIYRMIFNMILLYKSYIYDNNIILSCKQSYDNTLEVYIRLSHNNNTYEYNINTIEYYILQSICDKIGPYNKYYNNRYMSRIYIWIDYNKKIIYNDKIIKGLLLRTEDNHIDTYNNNNINIYNPIYDNNVYNNIIYIEDNQIYTDNIYDILLNNKYNNIYKYTYNTTYYHIDVLIVSYVNIQKVLSIHHHINIKYLIVYDSTDKHTININIDKTIIYDTIIYPFNPQTVLHKIYNLIKS